MLLRCTAVSSIHAAITHALQAFRSRLYHDGEISASGAKLRAAICGHDESRVGAARRRILLVSCEGLLPELPPRVRGGSFFPAIGTVAVFETEEGTKRRLRAVGIDFNSGHCRGWIFDAVET